MASTAMEQAQTEATSIWDSPVRSKRTEALPKNTLFGTALEVYDEDDKQKIKSIDLSVQRIPSGRKREHYIVPEFIQKHLQGQKLVVEKAKDKVERQRSALKSVRKSLKETEEKALFSNSMDAFLGIREGDPTPRREPIMTEGAKGLAKNMNHVGLNERNSYNRDKYGNKPPTHQYSLIGDVMRPRDMEMPKKKETTEYNYSPRKEGKKATTEETPRQESGRASRRPRIAVEVPANIQHHFGSKVCESLLADEKLVEKTLKEQKDFQESLKRKSRPDEITNIDKNLKPDYEDLGNFMRMNVFPGYNINHKISTTKSVFTDQVHLHRNPDPDKWRYQRDELSKWAEHNVIYNRMKKGWNTYLDSLPKAEANWDRNAPPRPKPAPRDPPPQPKKPRVKKPQQQQQKEIPKPEFEPVIFETPPMTPPPENSPVKLAPKAKRDDEFWDFYDQGGK